MTLAHWLARFTVPWMLVVGAVPATATQDRSPVELAIEMRDLARMPPSVMRDTQTEVGRTFLASGVRVVWAAAAASPESPTPLKLFIVGGMMADRSGAESGSTVVGLAPPSGTWAQVFYRRVLDTVAERQIAVSVVLAHVIAHEIGHLLLPPNSHSPVGVMRPAVDLNHPTVRRFTDEQSRLIRAAIVSGRRYAWPCDR